jgi:hypothetical protein
VTKPKSEFNRDRHGSNPGTRNLSSAEVCRRYNISESTKRRWEDHPTLGFPRPFKVTAGGANFTPEHELDTFDAQRLEQARVDRAQPKPARPFGPRKKAAEVST